MRPLGSEALFIKRMEGWMPNLVWIDYGPGKVPRWEEDAYPTLRVLPTDPIGRLDLRCCIGLDVIVEPADLDKPAWTLYDRLQQYAKTITLVSLSLEPEMGWAWHHSYGHMQLGDLHLADDLEKANEECSLWARKRNTEKHLEATQKRLAIESEMKKKGYFDGAHA